jgi:23S rRNA G2445 N2-methylase RlmL
LTDEISPNRGEKPPRSMTSPTVQIEHLNGPQTNTRRFLAFVSKGLGHISEKEIRTHFAEAAILDSSDKHIIFSDDSILPKRLLELKTVDDIHFLAGYFKGVENLNEEFIVDNLPIDALDRADEFIRKLRKVNETFSITLSRYKNRSVDLGSLRARIAKRFADQTTKIYTPFDHSNFDIRIHLEQSSVIFSCRIPRISLYVRAYRKCEKIGSLKPPIAAALCMLVDTRKGQKIVDNFCGSGTILCEAKLQGLEPYGGDIDEESVDCARINMRSLSPETSVNIRVLNASSTNWPDKYFDFAISNYPWGKQVALDRVVKLYSESISEYARILKDHGSIVLLGTNPDLIGKHLRKNFPHYVVRQFRIGFLGQTPWIISARPS